MYPYFQRNAVSNLHAAETARTTDPLRDFLEQNPDFGTLIFQVTGGQGAFPVAGANIVITKALDDRHSLSITITTDESGKTDPLSLPAPSRERSQSPGNGIAFAAYQALVSAPNYVSEEIRDLPIFDGITTIQPVNLRPDFDGQRRGEVEEVEDKAPDL